MAALQFDNFGEYAGYIKSLGEDNHETMGILKRNLRRAILEEVSEKQWQAMKMHYIDGMKMIDIANVLGVNVSTVSRNIKRGKNNLRRCLRYGAKELISQIPKE